MRERIHIWDWEHACSVTQLCPALCNPVDCSPPGSSVDGISQARILEWVAISFSWGYVKSSRNTVYVTFFFLL